MEAERSLMEEEDMCFEECNEITSPSSALPSIGRSPEEDRRDHQTLHAQDLEIDRVPAVEILHETADENISSTAAAAAHQELDINEPYYNFMNELQLLQRENISQIVKNKNLQELLGFGGVAVIAEALNSNLTDGLSGYQESIGQEMPRKFAASLFTSFLGASKNHTIILLMFSAILSLTFGLVEQGLSMNGCFDGGVALLATFIVVIFRTRDNFFRDKRSQKELDDFWRSTGGKMEVQVVRGGDMVKVTAVDLQVGDVALLRKGDHVPADGIFAYCDQALELEGINSITNDGNPFLFYGSRVINGNAKMIVTSVGMDTAWGETMIHAMKSSENKSTLETTLHTLDKTIQIFGILMTILVLIWLFLRYNIDGATNSTTFQSTIADATKALITGSMFVGLLKGFPSFISEAFFIWNRKTLLCKATVKDYLSCVKIASVTTVCVDKFGGLNEHKMEIDKFFVGGEFVCESSTVASNVLEDLCDGIGTLLLVPPGGCESKLMPLVTWAEAKLGMKKESVSERCKITRYSGLNPFQERCKVQIEKSGIEGKRYWHFRGPPQDILPLCSKYHNMKGNTQPIDAYSRMMFKQATEEMLVEGEAVAYACGWLNESDHEPYAGDQSCDLIFLGMIGLKDTNIEETKRAITTLKEGGIRIILASGDDVPVLQNVAQNCGLLDLESEDHVMVTAEEFRTWSDDEERIHNLENISIIGNCLPSDKVLLVKYLQEKGKRVALLGQGTSEAPGLKQADIGLTFGTWSSEAARDRCDINLWGAGFRVLVEVIENGRLFYENIQKFIQLELIITISSTLVNFTTTIILGDAALTSIELFWLNLVVASVGGLALLTIPSTKNLMEELPVRYTSAKLLTKDMLRNIVIQVSCQTGFFVTFQHIGVAIPYFPTNFSPPEASCSLHQQLVAPFFVMRGFISTLLPNL